MVDKKVSKQVQNGFTDAQDIAMRSMNTWNELLMTSTDMAFDVVLKNWNYSRSLRGSTDQAIEDAIKTQHRLTNEMMQVWQGYTTNVQEILHQAVDPKKIKTFTGSGSYRSYRSVRSRTS